MTTQIKESDSAWPSSNPASAPAPEQDREQERKIRVAFVEDDDDYREVVTGELGDHGFDVQGFPDGAGLLAALAAGSDPEIIILDWSLPSVSGIDLLPRLRRNGIALPVIASSISLAPAYRRSRRV